MQKIMPVTMHLKKLTNNVINLSYLKCIKHYFSIVDYRLKPKFDQFEIEKRIVSI